MDTWRERIICTDGLSLSVQARGSPMKQTLTPEQDQALRAFASEHGHTWKKELRDAWMRGSDAGELRQIRNNFGPSWLATFKLDGGAR